MNSKGLKFVAWCQMIGGAIGIFSLAMLILNIVKAPLDFPTTYFIVAPVLFSLSLAAGILILRRHRLAIPLSMAVQGSQVIQIISNSFTAKFIAGINISVFISSSNAGLSPGVNADYWIGPSPFDTPSGIAINLFAAVLLVYLIRTLRLQSDSIAESQQAAVAENAGRVEPVAKPNAKR